MTAGLQHESKEDTRRIFGQNSNNTAIGKEKQVKKVSRYYFLFPYTVGFFSGIIVAYILTILIGYIINKTTSSSSLLRSAFYGYLVGCQTT